MAACLFSCSNNKINSSLNHKWKNKSYLCKIHYTKLMSTLDRRPFVQTLTSDTCMYMKLDELLTVWKQTRGELEHVLKAWLQLTSTQCCHLWVFSWGKFWPDVLLYWQNTCPSRETQGFMCTRIYKTLQYKVSHFDLFPDWKLSKKHWRYFYCIYIKPGNNFSLTVYQCHNIKSNTCKPKEKCSHVKSNRIWKRKAVVAVLLHFMVLVLYQDLIVFQIMAFVPYPL